MKIALFLAIFSLCTTAHAEWPKEYRDITTGGCVVKMSGGADLPAKHRRVVEKTCACMTEGYEKLMPVERIREVMGLSTEEMNAAWENEPMRKVVEACDKRHGLSELPDLPVAAKDREAAMVDCALEFAKRADDFDDGRERVQKMCACVVDTFSRQPPPEGDEIDKAADACEARHLPPKK